ncbi:MAG: hypothetical protein A2626_02620 [Candidatus Nealsonbacteria bacterium RIFCSPHIGHO2_01_FULL_38_55]|uniref:NYN domain-containing protein n=2 Tax=Candidatus Nealsoniibacteriota TaxID=1817911 RepID=A0A1G2EHX5_9BACT|nr:MAG: hypothetical protein US88_C0021G0003 [Parcubacteria group bacterium GW2011_GWA2_38_27]KKQ96084.1 MAG: hypothetical protein UT22_C0041G0003 [Parcubacteria group bacterium GW2011_GWC2_39_11]OGZ19809.1 MAG: hypothetical protein A2626_02620 [Candidatus Nealsonbacteria bacterium RIFCSPHIGHO2_01_FULL_38_55]OGZ21759.1 MAG: hypothetical protein A3C48_02845 [Candidatus Nealsonbacteria bacterium RIFCSPHIGHO2_02_FULL_38_75]OGZ21951.1 MAG: hypothetical protein A2W55_00505 [Candidatus Nealsonbacteri
MGMPLNREACEQNILIKNRLEKSGFKVISKPLKKIYLDNGRRNFIYKCNFDVEIARDVIRNLNGIDLVILASSDSDFMGLKDDAVSRWKRFIFAYFEYNAAWEIRRSYHLFFEEIREKIWHKINPEN